jgi:hypothetical protein
MTSLYFDRQIILSPAVCWIFLTCDDVWSYNADSFTLTHAPRSTFLQQQQLW